MATRKAITQHNVVTATLSDEEFELLEAFAAEQGIKDIDRAIPAMIHELVRLHDQLWDAQFAQSTEPIDQMAQQALDDDRKGLTENLNI